jgi:hypothetical protein
MNIYFTERRSPLRPWWSLIVFWVGGGGGGERHKACILNSCGEPSSLIPGVGLSFYPVAATGLVWLVWLVWWAQSLQISLIFLRPGRRFGMAAAVKLMTLWWAGYLWWNRKQQMHINMMMKPFGRCRRILQHVFENKEIKDVCKNGQWLRELKCCLLSVSVARSYRCLAEWHTECPKKIEC